MIDTHTHLYLPEFGDEGPRAVQRAQDAGVTGFIFPNVDLTTIAPMRRLHAQFPDCTHMAMGLHPTEVGEGWNDDLAKIVSELKEHPSEYVAVGEIGMDLYWDTTYRTQQMEVLHHQLQLARDFGLPAIIHCREALDETLEVFGDFTDVAAVFHSFGGTIEDAQRILDSGPVRYFGINGIVTFKKSTLPEVIPEIPSDRILTETDSPYLAPVPYRGKRNESAYMPHTLDKIAQALGITPAQADKLTTANAQRFFNI